MIFQKRHILIQASLPLYILILIEISVYFLKKKRSNYFTKYSTYICSFKFILHKCVAKSHTYTIRLLQTSNQTIIFYIILHINKYSFFSHYTLKKRNTIAFCCIINSQESIVIVSLRSIVSFTKGQRVLRMVGKSDYHTICSYLFSISSRRKGQKLSLSFAPIREDLHRLCGYRKISLNGNSLQRSFLVFLYASTRCPWQTDEHAHGNDSACSSSLRRKGSR